MGAEPGVCSPGSRHDFAGFHRVILITVTGEMPVVDLLFQPVAFLSGSQGLR